MFTIFYTNLPIDLDRLHTKCRSALELVVVRFLAVIR